MSSSLDPSFLSLSMGTIDVILELAGYAFLMVLGWFVKATLDKIKRIDKTTTDSIDELRKELRQNSEEARIETNRLNITLPASYVTKLEFARSIDGLMHEMRNVASSIDKNRDQTLERMDKIVDKLDNKQDKVR